MVGAGVPISSWCPEKKGICCRLQVAVEGEEREARLKAREESFLAADRQLAHDRITLERAK